MVAATKSLLFLSLRLRQVVLAVLRYPAWIRVHRQQDRQKQLYAQEYEDDKYDFRRHAVVLFFTIAGPVPRQAERRVEVADEHRIQIALCRQNECQDIDEESGKEES